MRVPPLHVLSGIALAAALALGAPPPARAWITQTTDNSPTPTPWLPAQWWSWLPRPKHKPPAAPCRSKYCPPYYSETHGYTPPQWRPWPGVLDTKTTTGPNTTGPKSDVSPPKENTTPAKTAAVPTSLPEAVETSLPKK